MKNIIGGEYSIKYKRMNTKKRGSETFFSCGRSALYSILQCIDVDTKILLPAYLCSSITRTIIDSNFLYKFYSINNDLYPDVFDIVNKSETKTAILLINYFGLLDLTFYIAELYKKLPQAVIIIDDVHNYYGIPDTLQADFYFTSLRKWFPVPDGAIVKTRRKGLNYYNEDNNFAAYKYAGNLLKNYIENIPDSICLELIEKGEEILNTNYNCSCSSITYNLMQSINHKKIKTIRLRNASFLHKELSLLNVTHFYNSRNILLFLPIIVEDRNKVRKHFFDNNIFTPIHWPIENNQLNGESDFYRTELSLICDQRYSLLDMERILEVLRKCI